eukprot:12255453-Alexandrium_andersonii.AAC.1
MRRADGPDVVVLTMWADSPVADWPGPGDTGAPWPAVTGDGPIAGRPNAAWQVDLCPGCRRYMASLCLTARVEREEAIIVPAAPHVADRHHIDAN